MKYLIGQINKIREQVIHEKYLLAQELYECDSDDGACKKADKVKLVRLMEVDLLLKHAINKLGELI